MVPRSIGGIEVVGIIGTDGDIVTYAGDHPDHGTVALTILSSSAAATPGAVEEYLLECERRSDDPAESDHHLGHGVENGIPWQMTRLRGPEPTIHPLPPPVNTLRRRLALAFVAIVLFAVVASVVRGSDVATLSPDERSWAINLEGDWERSDETEPLAVTATQNDGPLIASGGVLAGVPNAAIALDVVQASQAAAQSFERVEPTDELWELGADVSTGEGHDQLIRVVSRPCAAFVLTVESSDGAFDDASAAEALSLSQTFRRIGAPPTFEKGAETPSGFVDVDRNGVHLAVPDGWSVGEDASCLAATSPDGSQTVRLDWIPGLDEAGRLAEWEEQLEDDGGSVETEGVTSRGKQRRVATTGAAAIALYVIEDDSGVYELEMTAAGAARMGVSELVVFDLVASTFEVRGTSADPS